MDASVHGLVFYCLIECHWSVIERKNYVSDAVAVDQTDMKFVTISIKPIPLGKPTSKCVTNITKWRHLLNRWSWKTNFTLTDVKLFIEDGRVCWENSPVYNIIYHIAARKVLYSSSFTLFFLIFTASEVFDVTNTRKKKKKRKAGGDPVMLEHVKGETNKVDEESLRAEGEDRNFMNTNWVHYLACAGCWD